jgi:hypothetical protein
MDSMTAALKSHSMGLARLAGLGVAWLEIVPKLKARAQPGAPVWKQGK